eukprot:COSAG06_NODE_120_length_23106_cov_18.311862_7_plen_167_part_00
MKIPLLFNEVHGPSGPGAECTITCSPQQGMQLRGGVWPQHASEMLHVATTGGAVGPTPQRTGAGTPRAPRVKRRSVPSGACTTCGFVCQAANAIAEYLNGPVALLDTAWMIAEFDCHAGRLQPPRHAEAYRWYCPLCLSTEPPQEDIVVLKNAWAPGGAAGSSGST